MHVGHKAPSRVVSDTGMAIKPSLTFSLFPDVVDILFGHGGGRETVQLMEDSHVLESRANRGENSKLVTSVYSGTLVLGAGGLMKDYNATPRFPVASKLVQTRRLRFGF